MAAAAAAGGAAASPTRSLLSIGQVLSKLSAEFPGLTSSKLRFLEVQGIVSPQRTSSGYRKFSAADVERLRLALTLQRDPLGVDATQHDHVAEQTAHGLAVEVGDQAVQSGVGHPCAIGREKSLGELEIIL